MSERMADGERALTEKEKQTLRLIVRGHDAKSVARELGLSVHTTNERLRDARRKLAVSSSREAARMLFEQEDAHRQNSTDESFGGASLPSVADEMPVRRKLFAGRLLIGGIVMSIAFAVFALVFQPAPEATAAPPRPASASALEAEQTVRAWLALVDAGRWGESFDATTETFKRMNTNKAWTEASEQGRKPLGAVRSRRLLSVEEVPAAPAGHTLVRFTTDFAAKPGATERVAVAREGGKWRVVGYIIE